MNLLIASDDFAVIDRLPRELSERGIAAAVAEDANAADRAVRDSTVDAVVLDVALPGEHCLALCERWRREGMRTPLFLLSAYDGVGCCLNGLHTGADDFLVKPVSVDELLARISARLSRQAPARTLPPLEAGELSIDVGRREVHRAGVHVRLSTREYQLAEYFVRNAGRVVSRAEIWRDVWGQQSPADSNVVDVYVRYLRNKLGRRPNLIRTIRGRGYLLESPTVSADNAA